MRSTILLIAFTALILSLSLRGNLGNPSPADMNTSRWRDDGPFELSPERGRFALIYSLLEDRSLTFSLPVARFVTPDLGYINDRYVSLFAPGVSFLVVPGYLVGKMFQLAQVGTYAVVALFALFNLLLIRAISLKLGASRSAAVLAGIIFLFATPAFAYSVSLYQHHFSTFLILMSVYLLLVPSGILILAAVFFLIAASVPLDYPNLFLMAPIGIYALGRLVSVRQKTAALHIRIDRTKFITLIFATLPLVFFFWFNFRSYGHPLQFSGTVRSVKVIDASGLPALPANPSEHEAQAFASGDYSPRKSALDFFNSRNLLGGFITHVFSPDRGILVFTPVLLFGILGIILAYRASHPIYPVLVGVLVVNLVLYSLWGDPWGGWAFGSRYLIPGYAVLSIFLSIFLSRSRLTRPVLLVFFLTAVFSVAVNTLGAVTTNRNPPRVEILELERVSGLPQKYTFARNWDFLTANLSKSVVYQTFASAYINSVQYYFLVTTVILVPVAWSTWYLAKRRHD